MPASRIGYYFTGPIQHDPFMLFVIMPIVLVALLCAWWLLDFDWPTF